MSEGEQEEFYWPGKRLIFHGYLLISRISQCNKPVLTFLTSAPEISALEDFAAATAAKRCGNYQSQWRGNERSRDNGLDAKIAIRMKFLSTQPCLCKRRDSRDRKFHFDYPPRAGIFSFPARVRDTSDAAAIIESIIPFRAYCSDKILMLGCLPSFIE